MPRPCGDCNNLPAKGMPYTTAYCRLCWLAVNDPRYAKAWEGKPVQTMPDPTNCTHRGVSLRTVECPSCGGSKVKAKVSACDLHGECTQFSKPIPGVRPCRGCPDYSPPEATP